MLTIFYPLTAPNLLQIARDSDELLKLTVGGFNVQERIISIEWLNENFINRVVIDLDIDWQFKPNKMALTRWKKIKNMLWRSCTMRWKL